MIYKINCDDKVAVFFINIFAGIIKLCYTLRELYNLILNKNCCFGVVNLLKLINLTKRYNINSVPAVFDINLQVNKGEIFGFIGPNGAGKTTTINMITGILKPTEGTVLIDGIDIQSDPVSCKARFGYVPDNPDIYERLTGAEYLNFICDIFNVSSNKRKEKISEFTEKFSISSVLNNQIKTYSHGMKQKLVLTGAFVHEPKLLILDEPMVGLDPVAAKILKDEMKSHAKKGNTVFFSTHILEVAEKLCTNVAIIKSGEIALSGKLEEIRKNSSLEDIFIDIVS